MGPGSWGPEWLGLLIATEINQDENLGFGARSLGPKPPLGLFIAIEINHDLNLGFGARTLGPGPKGLFIATEINHDVNLGFGPRSLGPRSLRVPHRHRKTTMIRI